MKPATVSNRESLCRLSVRPPHHSRLAGVLAGIAAVLLALPAMASTSVFAYTEHEDSITITSYTGPITANLVIDVPAMIEEKPVTAIGASAFANRFWSFFAPGLTVHLPDSVTTIGNNAFANASGLQSIRMPSSLVSIGNAAFQNCSNLPAITLPATLRSIGNNAFDNCNNLGGVVLPAALEFLGDNAFFGCWNLTSISIPSGITRIPSGAFQGCTQLASVTLPPMLTSIGRFAFHSCPALTSVTIPPLVNSIGDEAFRSCSKLASVTFRGNAPAEFGSQVFVGTAPGFTVNYYAVTTGFTTPTWKGYASNELGDNTFDSWRTYYDVPPDAEIGDDINGDGVNLLLAYALALNPNLILHGAMPMPTVNETADVMSLRFSGKAEGVNYVVETTTDLAQWTTDGVTLSEPDAGGFRTATVAIDGTPRFLRLIVSHSEPTLE